MSRIYVCERCIEDPDLQQVVREHFISEECDYCGQKAEKPLACELSDVLERMRFAVDQHYTDPRNFVCWDGREGGWQEHPVHDGRDLFEAIGWEVSNEDLMEDIVGEFSDEEFADEDFWPGPRHERQKSSWERFKHIVKHERRFTFWNIDDDERFSNTETQPKDMLESIGEAIRSASVTITIIPGADFWRARIHRCDKPLTQASDFSSPPTESARYPNRMSPLGIPMFYCANDFNTAVEEITYPDLPKEKCITAALFQNILPLNILDLTAIPPSEEIGFFNHWTRDVRQAVKFLRAFSSDISQRVKKDHSEDAEYVPTQVFTEFIRYQLTTPDDEPYHGVQYLSSMNGKSCYVLFLDQHECLSEDVQNPKPQVLSFVTIRQHH